MEKKKWSRGIGTFLVFAILICSMQIGFVVSAQDITGATIVSYDMEGGIETIFWNATTQQSSEFAHGGTQSLKIISDNPYGMGGFDLSSLSANKTYIFSFWTKIASDSPYSHICIGVQEDWGNIHQIYRSPELIVGGDFAQCTFEYTIPSGVSSFRFFFFGDSHIAGGSFYVDDLIVVQNKPYISSTNIVDGQYDVELDSSMVINFDIDMDLTTINTNNIKVNGSTDLISSITTNGARQATINFQNLDNFAAYTVTMKNLKSIYDVAINDETINFVTKDSGGEVLINRDMETDNDYPNATAGMLNEHWGVPYFTTAESHSGSRSILMYFSDNASWMKCGWWDGGLARPGKTVLITFWAKIDTGADYDSISLGLDGKGTIGTFTLTKGVFTKCTMLYSQPLDFSYGGIIYFVTPGFGITYIDDFKVEIANDTKLLPISTPADNAQNVALDSSINLKFNNNIKASTATTDNIKINGGEVAITGITVVDNTIIIDADFEWEKTYTITTSNIMDSSDRSVADVSKTFSTAPRYNVGLFDIYNGNVKLTGTNIQAGELTTKLDSFINNTDYEKNIVLVISLFDNDELVGISFAPATINAKSGLSEPLIASLTVPSLDTGIFKLKSFLWEDLTNIQPIVNSLELTE